MKTSKLMLVLIGFSILVLSGICFQAKSVAGPPPTKKEMPVPTQKVKVVWGAGGEADLEITEVVSLGGVVFWRVRLSDGQTPLVNPAQVRAISW
jgi:hypothetical protein